MSKIIATSAIKGAYKIVEQAEKMLDELIEELNFVLKDTHPLPERRKKAEKLQAFFDTLGDYSFYATKDCLREEPTMMGV